MQLTISEIITDHYLPEKRARRRANTVEGYESSFNLYVIPRFGHMTLEELDRDDIQAWVDSFEKPGAAKKAYKCLRQIVRWSIRKWTLMIPEVTLGIELPRIPAYRPKVLTAKESNRRIRGFYGFEHEATVILQHALGTRPGECYALEWGDIDKRTGEVEISKTLQQVRGRTVVYPTKTPKSERIGQLPKWALERLRQIWNALGRPTGRIIGSLSPAAISGRIRRYAASHGLPEVTLKNLRHTFGTLASQAGIPIEDIASMMGHSSIGTTYKYYLQNSSNARKKAQRKLSQYIFGNSGTPYLMP